VKPITIDDVLEKILDFFPDAQVWEDIEGELQISTGYKVVSRDGHIEPLKDKRGTRNPNRADFRLRWRRPI